jgi:hypothetical protein
MATAIKGKLKKGVSKIIETGPLKLWIAANQADPGPPLGPQIGQRGVNIAVFCKDFNEKTKLYRPGSLFSFINLCYSNPLRLSSYRKFNAIN